MITHPLSHDFCLRYSTGQWKLLWDSVNIIGVKILREKRVMDLFFYFQSWKRILATCTYLNSNNMVLWKLLQSRRSYEFIYMPCVSLLQLFLFNFFIFKVSTLFNNNRGNEKRITICLNSIVTNIEIEVASKWATLLVL